MKSENIQHLSGMEMPSPRKKHCSREETRARIIEKASELFHKFGFDRTSVAEIASSLGMSSANLYKFFPSKRALIETCTYMVLSQLQKVLWRAAHSELSVLERIEAVILSLYYFNRSQIKNDYEFYRLVLRVHQEDWACARDFRELEIKVLTEVLDGGVRAGEFFISDTLHIAKVILDSVTWITNPVLFYALKEQDVESRLHAQIQFLAKALK